jgi:8-oxo-dGTP diphosphatase
VAQQTSDLERAFAAGLRFVQMREPELDDLARRDFARKLVHLGEQAEAIVVLNAEPELALELGAQGVHLPAWRLMALAERPALTWVGASCHNRAELEKAAALGLDYALLGAVMPTPTHPGESPLGWEVFTRLAAELPLPVLALGGVSFSEMEMARNAGAHGIAAIRSAWEQGPS